MLSTLSSVKTHLGIPDATTTEDAALSQWLAQVDALVKNWTHQHLERADYIEYPDADGTDLLRLRQHPVPAVAAVYLESAAWYGQAAGAFAAATLLVAGVDYVLVPDQPDGVTSRKGLLRKITGTWPGRAQYTQGLLYGAIVPSYGTIKVQYTAGYAPVPADLVLAVNEAVAIVRSIKLGLRLQSETMPDYSYSTVSKPDWDAVLAAVQHWLAPYRALRW